MVQDDWLKVELFLTQFPDMSLRIGRSETAPKFSLENMRLLASKLGHPEKYFPSIHVAGTNGKGSVVSICASVLRTAGYQVGQYTSPHFAETLAGIKINGERIQLSKLLKIIGDLETPASGIPELSRFEIESMIAYLYFSQEKIDIAVIEVGLGGLLDASNIIDPILTVITAIDLEHQAVLGTTLVEIARHKAGIIHEGASLILAPQADNVREIILDEAKRKHVKVVELGFDFQVEASQFDRKHQTLQITYAGEQEKLLLSLLGRVQIENGALAYVALKKLGKLGFSINRAHIQQGFLSVRWPGRFEIIEILERIFILDAAHTPMAAKMLAQSLRDYYFQTELIGVFGISSDKDANKILGHFPENFIRLIATQSKHPRAMDSHSLEKIIFENGIVGDSSENSKAALKKVIRISDKGNPILVFGSVYLVEEFRKILMSTN